MGSRDAVSMVASCLTQYRDDMAEAEGVAYLRGMCINFTMYPTKPMIKTGYQEVSMCGRTS